MPAKKPSLQEVMETVQSLNVGMGAELVALRGEVDKLSQTIVGLSHMLANAMSVVNAQLAVKQAMTVGQPLYGSVALPQPIYTEDDIYKACYPLNASEKQAAEHGHLIDAIKSYRSRIKNLTGVMPDLKASKDLVQAHKDGAPIKPPFDPLSPPPLLESHKSFVKLGQKIEAIKAYRQYTMEVCGGDYAGLKEAKDIIDAYAYTIDPGHWNPQVQFLNPPF